MDLNFNLNSAPSALIPVDFRNGEFVTSYMDVDGRLFVLTSWGRCWQIIGIGEKIDVALVQNGDTVKRPVPKIGGPMTPTEERTAAFIAERLDIETSCSLPFSELRDCYVEWMVKNTTVEIATARSLGRYLSRYLPGYRSMAIKGSRFVNVKIKSLT